MHGYGKFTFNDGTIYEGEYRNGNKTGKGTEYNEDGFLKNEKISISKNTNKEHKIENEYMCNRKWNVKEYDKNGNLVLEIINGHGKGKEYNSEGKLIFEGDYNGEVKIW